MRILLAGGGSGGHVTPLKAIADALRAESDSLQLSVLTDQRFYEKSKELFSTEDVEVAKLISGKLRRYHGKSLLWHLTYPSVVLKNCADIILLGIGVAQASVYFIRRRPQLVFCKGGYVCVPVGLAARLFRVPLVIHDSDTRPGLTNRLLARWAKTIATGMPAEFYPYPADKMVHTGMPVQAGFRPQTKIQQQQQVTALGLKHAPVVLFTGGGNGAASLNRQVMAAAKQLLEAGWQIIHLTGSGKAGEVVQARERLPKQFQNSWQIAEFAPMLPRLLAADVVVTRTSASTLQESANAQKTVVGIASPYLTDQQHNAAYFAQHEAIISLDETSLEPDGSDLVRVLERLRHDKTEASDLSLKLRRIFARPEAAKQIAALLLATTQ